MILRLQSQQAAVCTKRQTTVKILWCSVIALTFCLTRSWVTPLPTRYDPSSRTDIRLSIPRLLPPTTVRTAKISSSRLCGREQHQEEIFDSEVTASLTSSLNETITEIVYENSQESTENTNKTDWTVYVCQSKPCLEKGAGATLGAFVGLAPQDAVTVVPAILTKVAKAKRPNVRCVYHPSSSSKNQQPMAFDVASVDSVEKVYRILTKHMNVKGVDPSACECLKWNYCGNAHLDKGEITLAIQAYDKAIATKYKDQEGVILVMRATAYLQRAFEHRLKLKEVIQDLTKTVPEFDNLLMLYQIAMETEEEEETRPTIVMPTTRSASTSSTTTTTLNTPSRRALMESRIQDKTFQRTKYHHALYEYDLYHAMQDSLRATQVLPNYAKTWLRAGDSLAELRQFQQSASYYEKALMLDHSLEETLLPIIDRLNKSQEFLNKAKTNGWTDDTLRVALAVAG